MVASSYIFFYYMVLFLPFFSLFLNLLFSVLKYKEKILIYSNLFFIFSTLFFSVILFFSNFFYNSICFNDTLFSWFRIGIINIKWGFICDTLTISMFLIVSLVSSLVHLYSVEYMLGDPNRIRFLNFLTLFTLSMFILISANNFVQMFIGWETVGICSYLLINFWDTRIQANTSALKAVIVNKVGDFGLVVSFILIHIVYFGNFNYFDIFSILNVGYKTILHDLFLFFIFLGCVGKSAQVFLHVWLPDAMEGPTPVSALIHAATMVTAGIFLIIRCSFLFEYSPIMLKIVLIVSSITALFAGSVALVQMDLKKVIAYSTCSQLGFMGVACGLSAYDIALFHLAMHAFFKALLFLSAGSIIHAYFYDEQDIRRLGGGFKILPITYISFFIGNAALIGFPFTAGYFSKDFILELLLTTNCPIVKFSLFCCMLAVFCTTFYSFRLFFIVFISSFKNVNIVLQKTHESSIKIIIPLVILSFFSIFGGYLFKESFTYLGNVSDIYSNSIFNYPTYFIINGNYFINWNIYFVEELSFLTKLISLFIVIFAFLITIYYYFFNSFNFFFNKKIYKFLSKKWYFDFIYNYFSRKFLKMFAYKQLFIYIDRGFIELIFGLFYTRNIQKSSFFIRKMYTGEIRIYFLISLLFFIILLNFLLFYFSFNFI